MKSVITTLISIFTASLLLSSCGGEQGKETQASVKPPVLDVPKMPTLIDQEVATVWLTEHFWDNMNPTDTAFKVYPDNLALFISQWGQTMDKVHPEIVYNSVKKVMERMKDDSTAVSNFMFAAEKAFYDPYAPKRNFEAYLAVVEFVDGFDKFSDVDKMRPRSQYKMLLNNRMGSKANNFSFITLDNKKYNLYETYGQYTLVFINSPDCPICAEYKDILKDNAGLNLLINNNVLQVIGIVAEESEELWREKAINFPANWVNGFNKDNKIKSERLYDVTVVPTLLLLDANKNVILKDVHPYELLEFFTKIHKI